MTVSPEGLTAPENLPLFLSNQPDSGDREDCHKTLAVCHHFYGTYGTSRRIFRRFGRGPTEAAKQRSERRTQLRMGFRIR